MTATDATKPMVFIASPSYDGKFSDKYINSLLRTKDLLQAHDIECPWLTFSGHSLVTLARNNTAAFFLAHPEASHLMCIDADIEWYPEDMLKLLRHDLDFVCGPYPRKDSVAAQFDLNLVSGIQSNGLLEAALVPFGFVLLKRAVFTRIIESGLVPRITDLGYFPDAGAAGQWAYDFYQVGTTAAGQYCGEDFSFCHVWRSISGRIWIDPTIRLGHQGTHVYEGDLMGMFGSAPAEAAA
jgi:hypothetical protein